MLLLKVGRILYVHFMTGGSTGNGPVFGKGKSIAVHLRSHANAMTEPHAVALSAESHMVGAKLPPRCSGSEEALQLILGKHMAYFATLRRAMGTDSGVYRLGSGVPCY